MLLEWRIQLGHVDGIEKNRGRKRRDENKKAGEVSARQRVAIISKSRE
jgi:hypothetical protein